MSDLKASVLKDIEGAAKMLDQALNRLHPSLDIYRELKNVDDTLDSIRDSLEAGDYDKLEPKP